MIFDNNDIEMFFKSDEEALEYINNSKKEIRFFYKRYFPEADLRTVKMDYTTMILEIKKKMLFKNWISIEETNILKKLFIVETKLIILHNFYENNHTFNKNGIGTVTLKENRFVRKRS